ncbi:MAG: YhcN/YlaJ family sporulation lipoprotein [Bacillota bacterium]
MKQLKKKLSVILVLALVMFTLSGCTLYRRPDARQQQTMPGPNQPTPITPTTPARTTSADQIVRMVNSREEVKNSYAVVLGNVAIVGVDMNDRISGDRENRLKDDISAQVEKEMPELAEVWVTADPDLVVRVRDLARRIERGEPISGFLDEVGELLKKLRPQGN